MHDAQGYFVGAIRCGCIRRLSMEHYSDRRKCLYAITTRSWTRYRPREV